MVRISECRRAISGWKKRYISNAQRRIKQLRRALEWEDDALVPCERRTKQLREELSIAYRDEESYWRQRSREKWLLEGDRNIKIFHASVKSTRIKNSLSFLLDETGQEQFWDKDKGEVAVRYFSKLFKSANPEPFQNTCAHLQRRVTNYMN